MSGFRVMNKLKLALLGGVILAFTFLITTHFREHVFGFGKLKQGRVVDLEKPREHSLDVFAKQRQTGQQTIPKIIHQIWNDEILPGEFTENVRGLVRDNPAPEWKYYFWTKETGLNFIQKKYPYLYKKASGAQNLLRSDLLRYMVINEYGGVYFDLDTVSVKTLSHFVDDQRCSFALEPAEHYFNAKTDFLLTNGALFCVKKHPFYTNILLHLATALRDDCKAAFMCTGPHMLSWLYLQLNLTDMYAGELPAVQPSEVFQDVYDIALQQRLVIAKCNNITKLPMFQQKICENWVSRGKEKRNVSSNALTYHTWFHILNRRLKIDPKNHIKNIVPLAMLYGKDFE